MTIIYHNPRCSKSRETLALLEDREEEFKVVKYLENPPSAEELREIVTLLGIKPIDLVRTQEEVWKTRFAQMPLSDDQVLEAMASHPRLIERPIVIKGNKAAIGRPPQKIIDIL
ncbi:MAG TPA: arsenate reductase (glutaredoxin) [Flavobacteriaceae bacterium]|nr:arsenate reductase (glutaredoxin) [Flavobacteriaceae bacterium]